MLEKIESLLREICRNVRKTGESSTQAMYVLESNQEAKLAYDVLHHHTIDVKLYADEQSSRLYVLLAALTDEKSAAIAQAHAHITLLKNIKSTLDSSTPAADSGYQMVFSESPAGKHISIQLLDAAAKPAPTPHSAQETLASPTAPHPRQNTRAKEEASELTKGPAVARKLVPKSIAPSGEQEDTAFKRFILYTTSHAFTGGSWVVFFALCMGIIFSLLVLVRAFMCPDLAVAQSNLPSYCKNIDTKKQN